MLAGMFLNLRFSVVLKQEQAVKATKHLVQTQQYKERINREHGAALNNSTPSILTKTEEVKMGYAERMLRELDKKCHSKDKYDAKYNYNVTQIC